LSLVIREADASDAIELQAYAIKLFAERLPGIFSRPEPTLEDEHAFIASRVEPANSTLLVAVLDGVIVGLVELIGGSLPEEAHAGTFGLSVDRDHRGSGVGTALLRALVEWGPAHGVSRIQAWVWANNPRAMALYERLGFEREGVCRRAIKSDDRLIDAVLVARLLED
jgi:RimJ/RimL family protein N-acetyltransferase